MLEHESYESLLQKLMNAGSYSAEYLQAIQRELGRRRVKSASTDVLIYEVVFAEKYSEENLNLVTVELRSRGVEVERFDDSTYVRCVISDFPLGWKDVLKDMFQTLKMAGWTSVNRLHYNFSFGAITIEGLKNQENEVLNDIVDQYVAELHKTCCDCGSKNQVEHFEDLYLCRNCVTEQLMKREIRDISEDGFSFCNTKISTEDVERWDDVKWSDIKQIAFSHNYDVITMDLSKLTEGEERCNEDVSNAFVRAYYISFKSDFHLNFFELLRHLPVHQFGDEVAVEVGTILSQLKKCKICEKTAVLMDRCMLCKNYRSSIEEPQSRRLDKFGTVEAIIAYEKQAFSRFKNEYYSVQYVYDNDRSYQ